MSFLYYIFGNSLSKILPNEGIIMILNNNSTMFVYLQICEHLYFLLGLYFVALHLFFPKKILFSATSKICVITHPVPFERELLN